MHCGRGVEIGLGGSHSDSDSEELRHFAGIVAEDMDAKHAVRLPVHDDLHEDLFRPA